MKKPEENMPTDLDTVEDLTLFANESFDTDDVDLFEFTGDDDSPLTRLKSIILSLDWEISDDILQELQDEVESLQQLWKGDKVAKVYLQGLYKIGNYLRAEGAYAHPNAIKLLLSFFYNFEKIISSETITGDAISSMLKSDVRKFKILQYQINQKGSVHDIGEAAESGELAIAADQEHAADQPECEPLTCLKATILGLEWEVTDKGLQQFNAQVGDLRAQFADNKSAQILIQGLQALGAYITDERADAHPEAFSMLHSFYEGLELLLDEKNIDEEEKQAILVDRVNSLNALKLMIAEEKEAQEKQKEDTLVDEILAPQEQTEEPLEPLAEIDESVLADDSELLDPEAIMPVEDTIADNLIEEELRVAGNIASLHGGADQEQKVENGEEVFEEELDLFFTDEDEEGSGSALASVPDSGNEEELPDVELAFTDEDLDIVLNEAESEETEEALLFTGEEETTQQDSALDELFVEEDETGLAPALSDAEEAGGFNENEALESLPEDAPTDEIDDKLDAFFGLDDEEEDTSKEITEPPASDKDGIAPALFDADEEGGFDEDDAATDLEEAPMDEIEDKLDAFFGLDEEEADEIAAATKSGEVGQDEVTVLPALADADEEEGGFDEESTVADLSEAPSAEIEDKLDAFFGLDDEADADETAPALADADEDEAIMPALADADEEGGFDEEKVVAGLSEEPSPEIEDKLDAFFSLDEEETAEPAPAATEDTGSTPSLAASLAGLAAGATATALSESRECVRKLRQEDGVGREQTVLLELLETTLTLLPEGQEQPPAMQELLTSLQDKVERRETDTTQLLQAVSSTLLVVAREVAAMRDKT